LFSLRDDPDGCGWQSRWKILGFAFSWVRRSLVSGGIICRPRQQGRGIGKELLAQNIEHARKAGATNKALIAFTFNVVSQGLYIRHGLFPRFPIYFFSIERDALMQRLQGEKLRWTDIEDTASDLNRLGEIDSSVLGIARERHHRYLLKDGTMRGYFFHAQDDCIGYAYVSATGHVGPLAVARPTAMGIAFTTALNLAAGSGASQVSAFLPGANETALGTAATSTACVSHSMVLVSTRAFGDWTRISPRNPLHVKRGRPAGR
jgi:hypothetical protein